MRYFNWIIVCGVIGLAALCAAKPLVGRKNMDVFEPVQFLIGNWTGGGFGRPGDTTSGKASFAFDLDNKIIVRKNRAEFAPKPGEAKGAVHEDLMIIYPKLRDPGLKAIYFDSEGNTINYAVSKRDSTVVFESEAAGQGPRFRLTYDKGEAGLLNTEFAVAPPGGEFKSYVKGTMKWAE